MLLVMWSGLMLPWHSLPGRYRGGGFIARANFQGGGHIHGSAVNRLAAIGIGGNSVSKEINFDFDWQPFGKETGGA